MRVRLDHTWIVTAATAVLAAAILVSCHSSKRQPDEMTVSAAQDEVYEVVIRHFITPRDVQLGLRQLVFDESVFTDLCPGAGTKNCKERVRKELLLEDDSPPFNSFADKLYRVLTHRGNDGLLRDDTIKNFLEKSLSPGPLSRTFHTDLPRVFTTPDSVFPNVLPTHQWKRKDFRDKYPGAGGIFSLSRVGFNSNLSEAIVSISVICGYQCRLIHDFVLKKKTGKWEIVSEWVPKESQSSYFDP